ncbi:DMT family transporter [Pseudodesulfovibrio sp.]|uniref:DMT family transporter n=1 Tax=Pseudodesulfovibrio sp. TaxID=2035812 RepID=UPI0026255968|nr:DMT family transporter [Pseudodesulfovibrio sp.]MDD3311035.1 DMT family transporter [Pseudodesulfovibrio sp.]
MRNWLTPGMRVMLLGTFLFSVGSLCVKLAGSRIPTTEILFVRGLVGIVFCWAIVRRAGVGMLGNRRWTLFTRGLFGFLSLLAEFYAIVHLPLADATVIIFTHPAVVALAAWFVLREKLSAGALVSIMVSLSGVVLVCHPGFLFGGAGPELDSVALGVALLSVALTAVAIMAVRSLAATEHPAVIILYPPMIICLACPLFAADWVAPDWGEWLMLLGVAGFMNAGQYYMTVGYAKDSAARISSVTCLEVVFAALWGAMFLGEIPDMWTIGGGLLIVAGTLALGRSGGGETPATPAAPAEQRS